ncbi:hypothetical protein [Candidatus Bealeia paramacronuclearis]|uniref:hypothetical protein n=1 Tax=Candidatus Bealeia paramacronuclearis TaxID=1921001 RepID=UPI002F26C286
MTASIFTGDPVFLDAGYLVPATSSMKANGQSNITGLPIGVFQGCEWWSTDPNVMGPSKSPYWPANTQTKVASPANAWVINDPNATWNIQVSSSAGGDYKNATVKQEQIGSGAQWAIDGKAFNQVNGQDISANPTTGSIETGQSGVYLDAATIKSSTDAGFVNCPIIILDFVPMPGNAPGLPFNNVIVGWNPNFQPKTN